MVTMYRHRFQVRIQAGFAGVSTDDRRVIRDMELPFPAIPGVAVQGDDGYEFVQVMTDSVWQVSIGAFVHYSHDGTLYEMAAKHYADNPRRPRKSDEEAEADMREVIDGYVAEGWTELPPTEHAASYPWTMEHV